MYVSVESRKVRSGDLGFLSPVQVNSSFVVKMVFRNLIWSFLPLVLLSKIKCDGGDISKTIHGV